MGNITKTQQKQFQDLWDCIAQHTKQSPGHILDPILKTLDLQNVFEYELVMDQSCLLWFRGDSYKSFGYYLALSATISSSASNPKKVIIVTFYKPKLVGSYQTNYCVSSTNCLTLAAVSRAIKQVLVKHGLELEEAAINYCAEQEAKAAQASILVKTLQTPKTPKTL